MGPEVRREGVGDDMRGLPRKQIRGQSATLINRPHPPKAGDNEIDEIESVAPTAVTLSEGWQ